jgi:hypothetical protein
MPADEQGLSDCIIVWGRRQWPAGLCALLPRHRLGLLVDHPAWQILRAFRPRIRLHVAHRCGGGVCLAVYVQSGKFDEPSGCMQK